MQYRVISTDDHLQEAPDTWPDSQTFIERSLEGVPEEERPKILVDNAVRVYNVDDD